MRRSALLLLSCAWAVVLHAQPELSITVMVRNPAPYALEQWRSDPTIVQVTVSNPTSSSKRFVLDLYLQNQNTRQEVQTNEMHPCMPVFELAPGQTRTLNGPELICEPSLVYDATIRTQLTTTGAIPEGEYRFCVRALDADSRSRELTSSGALCASTQVQWYDPPAIVRPVARDGGLRCDQAIVLNWQPPIPVPAPGSVVYRVRVVGMFEGQLPRQALEAATRSETVVDAEVSTTSYTIGANDPVMLDLLRRAAPRCIGFAWQVQALQATTRRPFPTRGGTQGKSTIETFTVECPGSTANEGASCSGAMSLRCYYPLDGDTIPWIPPHLIVQWSPYCDDVIGFTFELNVTRPGVTGTTGTNRRTLNWPRGPIEGQSLRGFPRASERAQLHIVNWQTEAGTTPAFNNDFRLGETYRWSVNGTLVRRESGRDVSYPVSTPVATVNLGLRMPRNPSPADGATIASGRGLTLQWEIPEPRQLGYVPEDLLTLSRGVSGMQFGVAAQFVRVVLARDSTFRTPVASWSRSFPATGNYITNDAAARELFGTKNWSGLNLENGTYYWRVEYASATDTSSVYRRGPVWRFTIGSSVGREECIALRPATPEHRSTITTTTVQFAVFAEPQIRVDALRSCQVRIWSMSSPSEDPRTVRSRAPALDVTITDHSLLRATASGAGTNLALLFINGSGPGSRTFTPTNGTTYLWECVLQFEGSRIRSDGISCDISTKSCEGIFTFRQGECNDPCTATEPTNRTPLVGTLSRGDRIRIGHFEAELEDVSGSPSSLSGRALVHLPWLNLRVRVSFSGLRVNTDRQVYEGTMEAVQASGSPLDATLANQLGGAGEWLSQDLLRRVHEYASDAARLASYLLGQPVELPIGFDRVIEGQQITVGIVGMVFRPTGAYLNAAIVFPLPWLGPGQHLGIGAREICFSPNGLGRTVELYLARDLGYRASDASWAINLKAPQEARGGMPPDSGTYVRFGCAGFEFLRVALEVEFPRSWMVPVPDDGSSPVRLRFTTTVRSTGDFIATARMNRFSPAGAPGFEMQCDNVVLDFSDRDNPEGIVFPSGYSGETSSRWQGFYLGTLSVQLPEQLRTFRDGPPQISLQHMIIDRSGVNFQALATRVIAYPQGNFGGWGASIDTIGLAVVNSSLQSGWMRGRFKLPVSDSTLRYSAILRDSSGRIRFEFTLQPSGTLNIPLWFASLDIDSNSWVRLEAGSGTGFVARALLNGTINFGGTPEIPLRMGGIRIQGFQIQTHERPYVQVQSISFASPPHALFAPPEPPDGPSGGGGRSAGGFPISIGGFEVVSGDRREGPGVGIRFTLSVNLHANTISGGTTLSLWGALQASSSGPPSFVFSGIDLDSIGLRADLGAVAIAGSVRFYNNDTTYGNGFRGAVTANFVRMVEVGATVQFGTVGDLRYWYVDARAIMGSGIPIFSGVALYGFGGGAWYNMRREGTPGSVLPTSTEARETSTAGNARVGATNSGLRFVPEANGWGFFASVTFGTHPKPDALNGDLTLTVSFRDGGIHEIELSGNARMLASLYNRDSVPITASAVIRYDFPARTFYGNFGVSARLEVASATGSLVLYFSPRAWYIKIGDPEGERVQIRVLDFINLQAYLMVGMNLPPMPPLPPEVTELLREPIPAPVRPDALGRGDGFAFGARADFAPPELRFLIFYASIRFLVGFDVALLNYGATAQCADGRPMGANGWYATGQMYARLDASVGLYVDLWFIQGKFEILGLTLGAALQAGLPNPTWIAGAVAGSYSILGGLISGYCNFRFTLGERCTPPLASALAAVEMISDIAPENGATDVSLFAEPTAFFNLEPDRPFALEEMQEDGSSVIKIFRIRVGRFTLAKQAGTSWRSVPVSQRSSRVGDAPTVVITPNDGFLEQRTRYRAEVMAFGQEYSDYVRLAQAILRHGAARTDEERQRIAREVATDERYWRDVYNRGRRIEQTVATEFVTEALPDTLRDVDILVAYPRDRQRFFLTGECRDGFIQLRANRQDLFNRSRSGDTLFLYRVRFVDIARNEQIEVPLTYRATDRPTAMGESPCTGSGCSNRAGIITFTLPSTLRPEAIYAVQVLRRDSVIRRTSPSGMPTLSDVGRRQAERSAGMTSARIQTTVFERLGSTLQVRRSTRPSGFDVARRIASNEKLLTVYFFRTSRYATLEQKVAEVTTAWTDSVSALIVVGLQPVLNSPEGFDEHDVNEYTVTKPGLSNPRIEQSYKFPPLIRLNAWGRSDRWHTDWVNPRVYDEMTWLCALTRCSSTSNIHSSRWHITQMMRRGAPMFSVISGVKSPLSDHEIGSATGDPMWLGLVRFARLSTRTFQAVPGATGGGSGIPGTMPPVSGMRVRPPNAITCSYDQPSFVLLDFSNLRNAATRELRWCGSGGDVGYDPATCSRLRAIAARTFVFPYRGEYTITASYLYCQDPDRPRSHQFRFRY